MPAKPKTPDLLHGWNQRKANSRELSRGKGKSGSCLSSTPERVISVVELNPCSLAEESKQLLAATPTSNSTPPIQASISPEVPCSSSVTPMPLCFATGHIIAGVKDRRKCRPRGVLTIGQKQSDGFQVSSPPSSLAGASICWVSSPLEIPNGRTQGSRVRSGGCDNEASVRWLLSPSDAVEKELETVSDQQKTNLDVIFGIETTPSSGAFILRTPTSNSSTSPFSVIVQKAEVSGLPLISSDKEEGEHCYANGKEVSPFSEKSWSEVNDISTPSYSNSRRNGVISPLENDSAMDRFKAMRISPKPIPLNNKNVVSPLPSLSFKFCCSPIPLNSIDLNCFRSSRAVKLSKDEMEEKNATVSSMRISWREGLLSRIFETGELDSYQCFFGEDDKENFDGPRDEAKSEPDFKYDQEMATSFLKERSGFGSLEYLVCSNESGVQKCEPKLPLLEPNSASESISAEVGGLISSGQREEITSITTSWWCKVSITFMGRVFINSECYYVEKQCFFR
ncbi:hypothetical protein HPP92_026194 [Vanilla planifolia]|uniref:Uncharacterized protein n=1 Tax=Vanilla planifolia TaxID=51239 RepID=A0A835PG34_VANPL|nr:hypothetical protein HPP92_026194 [Vanilla planifolia]KAG0488781.1 hypothetical protein HPP92_007592 [Vanilla planifolia]